MRIEFLWRRGMHEAGIARSSTRVGDVSYDKRLQN